MPEYPTHASVLASQGSAGRSHPLGEEGGCRFVSLPPVVASAGVIPVAAGAALLPFAVAITNAADCPATFTLQLTLLCYTDGMCVW